MRRRLIAAGVCCALWSMASVVQIGLAAPPAPAAPVPYGTGSALGSIAFGDSSHGWAVGWTVSHTAGLITTTSDGGLNWTSQSVASAQELLGVAASGPTNAWAVGRMTTGTASAGGVVATTDGTNWSPQTVPTMVASLNGVSFVNSTTGWAVGYDNSAGLGSPGAILATTNGGAAWTRQTVPAGVDLLASVSFVDPTHGWAVGRVSGSTTGDGAIIATSDGGVTWTKQTVPAGLTLSSLTFRDATHGWAAGHGPSTGTAWQGVVLVTSNGGTTWTIQNLPAGAPSPSGIAFANLSVGWVVGTAMTPTSIFPFIAKTTDGGSTWATQTVPPTNIGLTGVAATSSTTVWAVGTGWCQEPSILKTSNGGALWSETLNAVPVVTGLTAVTSVDATHAWAVGVDSCGYGAILWTADGTTWTAAQVPAGVSDLIAVSFADQIHGWAVGFNQGGGPASGPVVLATSDGGRSWHLQAIPADVGVLHAVRFVSATTGWAVGVSKLTPNQARILTTVDGGVTWTFQTPPAGLTDVGGLWFVDALRGWITGTTAPAVTGIFVTGDGGATWAQQVIPANTGPGLIDFVDAQNGWATSTDCSLGCRSQVLSTITGGATWSANTMAFDLNSLSFANTTSGWAVGSIMGIGPMTGMISASTNGGAIWASQTVPAGVSWLSGVSASSASRAWAVGSARGQGLYGLDAGVILDTSNSGTTWNTRSYLYPGMPRQAFLPALANAAYGGYTSVTYIQNLGGAPASVRINYFDASGTPVGVGDETIIQPKATWIVRQDNGRSFATGQPGSGVIFGSQPLAAFVNEFAPSPTADATSYTSINVSEGTGTTLYAPTIVNNAYGGYTTGIGLVNVGTAATNLTITYRDGAGTVVKTQTLNGVAAGAYQGLYSGDATLALPSGFAGTATIASSAGPIAAIVNETGPGGQFSSYDATALGNTTLYAPVALNNAYGGYYTGIAIQNTTGSAGTVTVNYYDTAAIATTKTFPIAPNGYVGVFQGSPTDGPAAGAYTAKITSTVAVAAIVNEVAPSATSAKQSTAYNAFATGAATLQLPLVESSGPDGWSTGQGIMNTGTAATTVTVTYFDTVTGARIGTPQTLTLQPNAFWGLYQPTGGLPSGTRASAVIRTSNGGPVAVICNESNATTFMSYSAQ